MTKLSNQYLKKKENRKITSDDSKSNRKEKHNKHLLDLKATYQCYTQDVNATHTSQENQGRKAYNNYLGGSL